MEIFCSLTLFKLSLNIEFFTIYFFKKNYSHALYIVLYYVLMIKILLLNHY